MCKQSETFLYLCQLNYSYICSVNSEPRPRTQNLKESHDTSGNWTSFNSGFFPTYCGSAAGISQPVQWVQHKIAEVRRERRNGGWTSIWSMHLHEQTLKTHFSLTKFLLQSNLSVRISGPWTAHKGFALGFMHFDSKWATDTHTHTNTEINCRMDCHHIVSQLTVIYWSQTITKAYFDYNDSLCQTLPYTVCLIFICFSAPVRLVYWEMNIIS